VAKATSVAGRREGRHCTIAETMGANMSESLEGKTVPANSGVARPPGALDERGGAGGITVLIPTFRRPLDLARCLEALKRQDRPPDEVILSIRVDDGETQSFLETFDRGGLPICVAPVREPGVVAAMNTGLEAASTDLVAITDDDTAPRADWLRRIVEAFDADPSVGGVGGRDCLPHSSGESRRVGVVQWFGRVVGGHHLGVGPPREVQVLKGANCAYRRTPLQAVGFDRRLLGRGAQVGWEVGLGLAFRRAGWTLVYDPAIAVDHFPATRHDDDQNHRGIFTPLPHQEAVHNVTLALWEHASVFRKACYALGWALFGTTGDPGLLLFLRGVARRDRHSWSRFRATMAGRASGVAASNRSGRTGSSDRPGRPPGPDLDARGRSDAGPPGPSDDRLRIALVVHEYNRRMGHSRYVAELASRFKKSHEVHVYAHNFEEPDPEGITFHRVPASTRCGLATVLSFAIPSTAMIRRPFDIVHSQGFCTLRQNVVTAHLCQPAWFESVDRFAREDGWRKRIARAFITNLDRLVMRPGAAARFIAPSDRVRADLSQHYDLIGPVRVVRHGTDVETFHPRNRDRWRGVVRSEWGVPGESVVALYVGDPRKGLPAAIRAAARVPEVHLVAVTRSPARRYLNMADEAGLGGRLWMIPATSRIERHYAAADLFLFPTFYDAFGLVAAEAMATGLPVITNRAAGVSELIEHGVSGWLTDEPWDDEALAAAVAMLARDVGLRDRMGAAARAAVEANDWDRAAEETMNVYREVVAEARKGSR